MFDLKGSRDSQMFEIKGSRDREMFKIEGCLIQRDFWVENCPSVLLNCYICFLRIKRNNKKSFVQIILAEDLFQLLFGGVSTQVSHE